MPSKKKLSGQSIGTRLQSVREIEGYSQSRLAQTLAISKSRLAAFETGRNPIRCEIGLRICRRLIINEEWFATGDIPILEAAMRAKQYDITTIKSPDIQRFLRGMCVDLGAEREARQVPLAMLFGEAFQSVLLPAYKRLAPLCTHMPRLVVASNDSLELMANYVRRMNIMSLEVLDGFEKSKGGTDKLAARSFTRAMVETGMVLSSRYMGRPTPEIRENRYNFLRAIANDDTAPIGPLFPAEDAFPAGKK